MPFKSGVKECIRYIVRMAHATVNAERYMFLIRVIDTQ